MAEIDGFEERKILRLAKGENQNLDDVTTVLVTGYGPFLDRLLINPSWTIASNLPSILPSTSPASPPIRIIVYPWPLRVSYSAVLATVPSLLQTITPKPDIILHIGLANMRTFYACERGAHKSVYNETPDVDGEKFPRDLSDAQWPGVPEQLGTGFDVDDVYRRWLGELKDLTAKGVEVRPSPDAGSFLCGFVYYTSMAEYWTGRAGDSKECPVMFMHTPPLEGAEKEREGVEVTRGLIRALVESWRAKGAGFGTRSAEL